MRLSADRRVLGAAASGTMLSLVSFTAPLATINPISQGLSADVAGRTWILSSMSIGLGAALLTAGTVADDRGRRRTFVAGLARARRGLGGRGAGAVRDWSSSLARVVQGVGAAAVIASSLGLIAHTFPAGSGRARRPAASGAPAWGRASPSVRCSPPASTARRSASWRDVYGRRGRRRARPWPRSPPRHRGVARRGRRDRLDLRGGRPARRGARRVPRRRSSRAGRAGAGPW